LRIWRRIREACLPHKNMSLYAIDAQSANKKERTGVEQYAFQIIEAMKKEPLKEGERVVLYSPESLEGELGELPSGWESKILKWPIGRGWMSLLVGLEMLRHAPDVLFVPSQGLPSYLSRAKIITTIHDLAFARCPDLYHSSVRVSLLRTTKRAVKKATKILVPSQATKNDLMEIYKINEEKIVVTPLAPSLRSLQGHSSSQRATPFFITIGRMEKKKNITTLIRAFEIFKSRRGVGDPFELVLMGKPGFGYGEIKKQIDFSQYRNQIRELGYVADDEAADFLSRSTAYVFPSWYEGFGIPNLDAMTAGVPIIASDIAVHREVVADAGLFAAPDNAEELAAAFERIAGDAALRDELIARGKRRVAEFLWEKTAGKTWEVMRG